MLPKFIIHADWSISPKKRWLARAQLQADGRYQVDAPEPVGDISRLWTAESTLVGVDFPIGLPWRYAEQVGVTDFLALLPELGKGRWAASPLFWTMGAQQVGKAAISGWRALLLPALERGETAVRRTI